MPRNFVFCVKLSPTSSPGRHFPPLKRDNRTFRHGQRRIDRLVSGKNGADPSFLGRSTLSRPGWPSKTVGHGDPFEECRVLVYTQMKFRRSISMVLTFREKIGTELEVKEK